MTCPSCEQINTAPQNKLQHNNLEIKIKCCNCCKLWASIGWKCSCGVRWHTCHRHARKAHTGVEGKRAEISRNKYNKASKRPLDKASLDQILDDDSRLESKHARNYQYDGTIDLGTCSLQANLMACYHQVLDSASLMLLGRALATSRQMSAPQITSGMLVRP